MTVVVRLPEDFVDNVKQVAALQGRHYTDALADAWAQYLETHREQLAATFEEAAALIRAGDTSALAELASRSVDARAAAAARAARGR
jgi:hypothetical protein